MAPPPARAGRARALVLAALAAGCSGGAGEDDMQTRSLRTLRVESSAFEHEGLMPARYSCDGDDVSPPLAWEPGPDGTVSYALIAEDPDAPRGTWVHWVAWNLSEPRLREAVLPSDALADGGRQGRNSWRRSGYGGPCPPSGTHRYYFRVFALDTKLELSPDTDADGLRAAMRSHLLAQGELMGRYTRQR